MFFVEIWNEVLDYYLDLEIVGVEVFEKLVDGYV